MIQPTLAQPRKRQHETTLLSAISHHHRRHQDEPKVAALYLRPLLDQGLSSQACVRIERIFRPSQACVRRKQIFSRAPPPSSLHHGGVHSTLTVFSSIDEASGTFSAFVRLFFAMIDRLSLHTFPPCHYAVVINRIDQ
jgi:hypothetical protein